MGDLEQQCENAVFEICDARERYPLLCANEFGKAIKLINEINMMKVNSRSVTISNISAFTSEQCMILQNNLSEGTKLLEIQADKLQIMIDKIKNLNAVLEQIKRDKVSEINKLLWS